MSEGFERQRGNRYCDFGFLFPITLSHVEQIKGGENLLRPISKCSNSVLANRIGYIACYDFESHSLCWTIETPRQSCQDVTYNDELYILGSKEWLARYDSESGLEIWETNISGDIESIKLVTSDILLTNARYKEKDTLYARSKQDGSILWSYEGGGYGPYGGMLCEKGILIVKSRGGFHVFDESTGELLWKCSIEEWQKRYLPNLEQTTSGGPYLLLLAEGVFYLGFNQGVLAAVDVKTAELRWFHCVQRPQFLAPSSPLVLPWTVIARGQELIFTISQARGHTNYLNIVNVNNGELIYQSDRNITPEGCRGPVVLKQLLVGGAGRYLSAFDIDKKEFVWEYEYPGKLDLFSSTLVPFEGGFVVAHNETSTLHWFTSQK